MAEEKIDSAGKTTSKALFIKAAKDRAVSHSDIVVYVPADIAGIDALMNSFWDNVERGPTSIHHRLVFSFYNKGDRFSLA